MTPEQIQYYKNAAEQGTIQDDKNPLFLLQTVHTDLLVGILKRDFEVIELARRELQNRGLNEQGKWVGFSPALVKKNVRKGYQKNTSRKGCGIK